MCGIVGIFNRDPHKAVDQRLLSAMTGSMSHRGPDDEGVFFSGPVGFGHRRLAIIDIASGQQPMTDRSRSRTLIYNGEIYNYRELQQCLIQQGVELITSSDTEVILKSSSFSSFEWLEKFNGMFAFALWDEPSKSLLLVRDRLGVKPLYYTASYDSFIFASEITPLLLHPQVRAEVNPEKIPEYLAFRDICGVDTMFKNIFEVPPGCVLLLSLKHFEPQIVRFWREGMGKRVQDFVDPSDSAEDQLNTLLTESVRYRLISEVPVGIYNSGGVDSSLITAITRTLTTGTELHTFSVGFEEASYDESQYAQVVANKMETIHHTLVINEAQYASSISNAVLHLEEPINHPHTVQLLHLSKFAKEHVTVVLTGEGADELFGGYPRYRAPLLSPYLSLLPKVISQGLFTIFQRAHLRKAIKIFEDLHDCKRQVTQNARLIPRKDFEIFYPDCYDFIERDRVYERAKNREGSLLNQLLFYDQRTYLPSLLKRLDKMSMAASIECRVPFLDYRLVEWSYLLTEKKKAQLWKGNKILVKKLAERWFARKFVYRSKSGFGVPISAWLRNPKGLGQYLDILTDRKFKERGYFEVGAVERLIKKHTEEVEDHSEILWSLLNFELWHRVFIDGDEFRHKSPT
ncbi:MAG: asparagine synthase (glutamine-hydrolyzing) [Deltaproteobacteria bacterium]|nr:asparagine synthase (glutamine-hydrolyzing) [Deltaproteobacteria bacterium]